MNDPFADAVGEVVRALLEVHEELRAGSVPAVAETRERFIRAVDAFARKGREQPAQTLDYDLARCALVYWIDEMLTLHWGWPHAEEFRAVCLELHYPDLKGVKEPGLGRRDRVVEGPYRFYEMAAEAKLRDETDALEAFWLCVALGFRGQFYIRRHLLEEWVRDAHDHIVPRLKKKDEQARRARKPTAIEGPPLARLGGQHRLWGVSVLVASTAVVTLIAFIVAVHLRPY